VFTDHNLRASKPGPLLTPGVLSFIMFCVPAWVIDFLEGYMPVCQLCVWKWWSEVSKSIIGRDCMPSDGKEHTVHVSLCASAVGNVTLHQVCKYLTLLVFSVLCWKCHRTVLHNTNVIIKKLFATNLLQDMMRNTG
jgi:hypothetical protein